MSVSNLTQFFENYRFSCNRKQSEGQRKHDRDPRKTFGPKRPKVNN